MRLSDIWGEFIHFIEYVNDIAKQRGNVAMLLPYFSAPSLKVFVFFWSQYLVLLMFDKISSYAILGFTFEVISMLGAVLIETSGKT